ncbi:hypothetical protein ABB37_04263 [Leptomonas pyrrhocoris]|uniref:SURP motif domain-containing protein n=1 Tax=Leptomonas pyrrhocoris TaxID=157538 RepID=A0A0N0DVT4_LEPPY|nr:hypothetical protein ABB37_04263 [Leptomonas pyrrhocoris]KPA80838.1 hypothetical protein ABB37_04263 [Leptomonas pyrrhocoris]|eukprot:XP_015659277.1 hypothetical protein ABB37_04263 [Leptomonas pyrrhocoris]
MRRAPPVPPPPAVAAVATSGFTNTLSTEEADDGNNDLGRDEVGFESATVLYDTAHVSSALDGGDAAPLAGGANAAASSSPYALYEPMRAQQQHGVLDALHPTVSSSNISSRSNIGIANSSAAVLSSTSDSAGILGPSAAPCILPPPSLPPAQPYAYVEEGLDVPLHAPRLRIPADLPLEQTTLMDLLATVVVHGGPTTEEEIVKRELTRRNPAFAFLGEKFNHPSLLYYRWRLYSLLQQDTLLAWRTESFQVERARRAYVFVPPPLLRAGPDCLAGLHQPELLNAGDVLGRENGVKRTRESGEGGEEAIHREGEEDIITRTARRRRKHRHQRGHVAAAAPATRDKRTRRSRGETEEEEEGGVAPGYGVASHEDGRADAHDKNKNRGSESSSSGSSSESSSSSGTDSDGEAEVAVTAAKDEAARDEKRDAVLKAETRSTDASTSPAAAVAESKDAVFEVDPVVPLPPPSAQWISRQCTANKHVFAVLQPHICAEWARLLNPRRICPVAACTSIGKLCEMWLSRTEVAARMLFAVQHADGIHHLLSVVLDAVVKTAYVATARSRATLPLPSSAVNSLEGDSNVFCVEALWYLYVLHDILMNASSMPSGSAATACCVNKNPRPASNSQPSVGGEEDEPFMAVESSQEALETLYLAWKQQQQQQSESAHSASFPVSVVFNNNSNTSAAPPLPSSVSSPTSLAATSTSASSAAHATAARHRRRQRTTRRRSVYERCGDALELILPTLIEAVTAVALAVSMDKERQPRPPQPESAKLAAAATAPPPPPPAARVHHFKVVNPLQSTKAKRSGINNSGGGGGAKGVAVSAPPLSGGPCLSLRLDAGCSRVESEQTSESVTTTTTTVDAQASSAPAVLLIEWLKALVLVWMNVEQPLLLPLPSAGLPAETAKDGAASDPAADTVGMEAAAPTPSGLLWPDTQRGAPDAPDVQLAYFVRARHARLLGLEAAPVHGSAAPPSFEKRREPPLLSARACAILKERYSFLF